jgi:hypothetical protein
VTSLADMIKLAPLIVQGSSEKQVIDTVMGMCKPLLMKGVGKTLNIPGLLDCVKGSGSPSSALVSNAEFLLKLMGNDELSPIVMKVALQFLEQKGIAPDGVLAVFQRIGSVIDESVVVKDIDGLRNLLILAAKNIVDSSPVPEGVLYRCPACSDVRILNAISIT